MDETCNTHGEVISAREIQSFNLKGNYCVGDLHIYGRILLELIGKEHCMKL